MILTLLAFVYGVGAARITQLCFAEAHYYPNWYEPNFLVPTLASIFGWPILLLISWGRTTWAFFSKGEI